MNKKLLYLVIMLIVFSMLAANCTPAPAEPAAEEPMAEEPAAEEPAAEEPAADTPTDIKIAVLTGSSIEQPYVATLINAFDRFNEENEYGLTISYDYTENIWGDEGEVAIRAYAETGEYDIVWAHSAFSDQVANVMDEYPELMFVFSGSGNTGRGNNAYFLFAHLQDCAYLTGVAAGMMTKTNVLGAVAGYPYEDVTDVLNGFIDGAKSVNEDVKVKIAYIESWYDPPKAEETTYALIAAGADLVYAERFGCFEALADKGLYGFGNYGDQYDMAPDVVLTSATLGFDPHVDYIIGEWWGHEVEGKAWNGTIDPVWYGLADGGCDIAPFRGDNTPQDVQDAVMKARDDIISGDIKVELKTDPPESD